MVCVLVTDALDGSTRRQDQHSVARAHRSAGRNGERRQRGGGSIEGVALVCRKRQPQPIRR